MSDGLLFALLAGVAAIIYGIISTFRILSLPQGNDEMKRIALAIQEGAAAYLKRQYMTIGLVGTPDIANMHSVEVTVVVPICSS